MANILIVDYDLQVRRMLKELLEIDDHQVDIASDALEATFMLHCNLELIIANAELPVKSGIAFIHQVQYLDPTIKAIVIADGNVTNEELHHSIKTTTPPPIINVIQKPFNSGELKQLVIDTLQTNSASNGVIE